MARPKMTQQKRARDEQRREKARAKEERRVQRGEREDAPVAPGEDPQLAGIVPGPQPPRDDY